MTGKGAELYRARKRRTGLSREKLAALTGVSARTIQRIEAGESATSANIAKLERELAPELAELATEQLIDAPLPPAADRTLSEASSLELAAELMKRIVAEHSAPPAAPTRPPVYEWKTEDYPEGGTKPQNGHPGVAES